jgi:hypothetical protein
VTNDLDKYRALIAVEVGHQPVTVRARVDRDWMGGGGSQPRRWTCSDGEDYSVKHPNNPQVAGTPQLLATEYVVARVGAGMSAPVFPCAIVDVAPELVMGIEYRGQPGVEVAAGRAFGSFIRSEGDVVDAGVAPPGWRSGEVNRPRAAAICVLHALFILGDSPQYVVRAEAPFEVWSIDHGHFIGNGSPWAFAATPPLTNIETTLFPELALTPDDVAQAALPLVQLTDEQLARAIAGVPAEWLADVDLRGGCLKFLVERRDQIRILTGLDSN